MFFKEHWPVFIEQEEEEMSQMLKSTASAVEGPLWHAWVCKCDEGCRRSHYQVLDQSFMNKFYKLFFLQAGRFPAVVQDLPDVMLWVKHQS